ncbi:beta-catenin-like protein 1, partial [Mantella aurantiaca]
SLFLSMSHVCIAVVDLLQELTDIDTLHESEEGAQVLIDALVEGQVIALLVQNLERLDESVKEEADGVHNTLAIIENLTEFRPEICTEAAQQGLLQWLLKRLKAKMPFDANKLYGSEILAILLQNNDDTRELLGELDGIDVLLQQLSVRASTPCHRSAPWHLSEAYGGGSLLQLLQENVNARLPVSLSTVPPTVRQYQGTFLHNHFHPGLSS